MRKPRPLGPRPAEPQPATPTEDSGGFHANVDWMMAVLSLGAAGLAVWKFEIAWNFDFESRDVSPIIFVPVFIGTYGLYHLVKALWGTLRGQKFGVSTLTLHGGEVRMGAVLKGAIRTAVELRPLGDYVIRLQCIETFAMYRGGDETRAPVDHVRWQAEAKVPRVSANSKEGIPFEFILPAPFEKPVATESSIETSMVASIRIPGLQHFSAHNRSPHSTRWVVTIDAPLRGMDYHAVFGVVVKGSTHEGGVEIMLG